MTGDSQSSADDQHPISKFHFNVDLGPESEVGEILFQEASGMDLESQIIEYNAGNDPQFSTVKMPGLKKSGNVILKNGIFPSDDAFWGWYGKIKMNTIARTTVTIKLIDEAGTPLMTWVLTNAWPTKVTVTDIESDGDEVAVEIVEIVHEGIAQNASLTP